MKKPIDYTNEIDGNFLRCKAKRLSRLSVEWGKFSADMNKEIRERIENNDPDSLMLKYVFIYWVVRSQHLQLLYEKRGGLLGKGKIRRKDNECREIRNIIKNGIEADPLNLKLESNWAEFIGRIVGR